MPINDDRLAKPSYSSLWRQGLLLGYWLGQQRHRQGCNAQEIATHRSYESPRPVRLRSRDRGRRGRAVLVRNEKGRPKEPIIVPRFPIRLSLGCLAQVPRREGYTCVAPIYLRRTGLTTSDAPTATISPGGGGGHQPEAPRPERHYYTPMPLSSMRLSYAGTGVAPSAVGVRGSHMRRPLHRPSPLGISVPDKGSEYGSRCSLFGQNGASDMTT
ncbi:hypothetical protein BC826DRAFT_1157082 [Russula brevipes]|nr:hypothetical protein BC826DRAFT_1157082 [Russula brevipes]